MGIPDFTDLMEIIITSTRSADHPYLVIQVIRDGTPLKVNLFNISSLSTLLSFNLLEMV